MTDIEKILSEDYADYLISFPYDENFKQRINNFEDILYQPIDGIYGCLYIRRDTTLPLPETLKYYSRPNVYKLSLQGMSANHLTRIAPPGQFDSMPLINSGIVPIQEAPLRLTGKGVIIGFADSGIDWQNELFRKADGSTRILAIWDQTIQDGPPPSGFLYGTEYTKETINAALQSDDPHAIVKTVDTNGEGTALASIAGGSAQRAMPYFTGVAPDCEIVFIKVKEAKQYLRDYYFVESDQAIYSELDLVGAYSYMSRFARTFESPLINCVSLVRSLGNHSDSSKLSRFLESKFRDRHIFGLIAAGNEGNAGHHYAGRLNYEEGLLEDNVEIRVGLNCPGFILQFWARQPYGRTFEIRSPGGETIGDIIDHSNMEISRTLIYEKTKITIRYLSVNATTGDESIDMRIEAPTPGIWTFRVKARGAADGSSEYNLWLASGVSRSKDVYFLRDTPYITITDPGMIPTAITVGVYDDSNNSFWLDSGRGFSSKNEIKPNITAPGLNISSAIGEVTGSGAAMAIAAGATAQFLQWAIVEKHDQFSSINGIVAYLERGATRSSGISYPSREWGYGRLNLKGSFDQMLR